MDSEKLVIKRTTDVSLLYQEDLSSCISAVPYTATKTTTGMFKKGIYGCVGFRDAVEDGEIVQLGFFKIKYKVFGNSFFVRGSKAKYYRLRRVDGNSITTQDISGIESGQNVRIVSRKTFKQLFDQKHGL